MDDSKHEGCVSFVVGVFAGSFPPAFRGGGPIRSVDAIVRSAPKGVSVEVLTSDRDLGSNEPLAVKANTWLVRDSANVYYGTISSPRKLLQAFHSLRKRHPQLLHFNSFFTPRLTIAPLMLWRFGFWGPTKLLVSPRGEFGDGALSRRAWKKRLYIAVFRLLRIHRSVIWHSTAEHETHAIHAMWGARARVVFRENDTLLPATALVPAVPSSLRLRAVYLGRIVDHKGVLVALEALTSFSGSLTLDIYGTWEDPEYARQCEKAMKRLPPNVSVTLHDAVLPENVRDVFADHDLFLLPTAGENFGHVVAEALSVSCVVVTTPHTPWTGLLRDGAGVIVPDRSPEKWREQLESIAKKTPEEIFALRVAAGRGFNKWAARPRPPHLWELVCALD